VTPHSVGYGQVQPAREWRAVARVEGTVIATSDRLAAGEIAEAGPLAVMAVKQAINRAPYQSFDEALSIGGDLSALLMFSSDREEGLAAFLQRRKPEFKGE